MSRAILTLGSTKGPVSYAVSVVTYNQGYNVQFNNATVRDQKHSYPIRVKETDFAFTIQCRSIKQYDVLKTAIRTSHLTALKKVEQGLCRFIFPAMKIDYLGYISQAPEGIRRFEYTPQLPLTMLLVKDTINTVTTQYSSLTGTWQDIYGPAIADLYNKSATSAKDADDGILSGNKPNFGGGRGPAAQ